MNLLNRYGPWAVIAGASEGVGRAFACELARHGIRSVLIARRETPLLALAAEIRAEFAVECTTASIDLGADGAAARVIEAAGGREVGLFISNAGADPNGARFLDKDIAAWRQLLAMNTETPMECCHHFAAAMRSRGRGGVILVNSGACYGGALGLAAYSGGKAFNLCFSEGLWAELKPHGVDVLSLVLGQTDTPAYRALLAEKGLPTPEKLASPEAVARVALAQLPRGPIYNWGQPNDVAGMAPSSADDRRARVEAISCSTIRLIDGVS